MHEAPTPAPGVVTRETFAARVRALLGGRGGSRPWPKRQGDRWILLYCLTRRIDRVEELAEREANVRIQDWLLGPGRTLEVDFVTLRRALVDEGFWDRDDGGTRYRRAGRHTRRVRFEDPLPDETGVLAAPGTAAGTREPAPRAGDDREPGPAGT